MGLIAGALAKYIMPGEDPGGIIVTILIGIAGSFIGSYLASMLGFVAGGLVMKLVVAVVGALILLALWKFVVAPMLNK
ncbi:MAG: GlsB/YeaQ/YmgE family stress response membrane protein [Chitinophagales bacterium]|nr:GlsB/YeaQ/YmgE family stress response membrane protein [Chitinophagales bacterium]